MHERIIHSLTTRRSWTREKVSNNIQDIRNRKVRMYTLRYLSYFNDRKTQGNTKSCLKAIQRAHTVVIGALTQ